MEGTADPPGPLERFEVVTTYPEVAKFVGPGARLLSINAYYVRSDGTLNLGTEDYFTQVRYAFQRPYQPTEEEKSLPLGAGGNRKAKAQEMKVLITKPRWVSVQTVGGGGCDDESGTWRNRGMSLDPGSPGDWREDRLAPAPACTFKKIWAIAAKNGVPTNAVARIEYDYEGYTFRITDADILLFVSPDCTLETRGQRSDRLDDIRRARRERQKKEGK